MEKHRVVAGEEGLAERRRLLDKEKEFTQLRDPLSQLRRGLTGERVGEADVFGGHEGGTRLAGSHRFHRQRPDGSGIAVSGTCRARFHR